MEQFTRRTYRGQKENVYMHVYILYMIVVSLILGLAQDLSFVVKNVHRRPHAEFTISLLLGAQLLICFISSFSVVLHVHIYYQPLIVVVQGYHLCSVYSQLVECSLHNYMLIFIMRQLRNAICPQCCSGARRSHFSYWCQSTTSACQCKHSEGRELDRAE